MSKKDKTLQLPSFLTGLVSVVGVIMFLSWPGRNSGLEGLARFYKAVAVCLPITLIPGILSFILGINAGPKKKFKWWLIPACSILVTVFGFFALLFIIMLIA